MSKPSLQRILLLVSFLVAFATNASAQTPYAGYSVTRLHRFLATDQLTRNIGSQYEYSNLGGGLLGHVLALPAGANYEVLVELWSAKPRRSLYPCEYAPLGGRSRAPVFHMIW